MLWRYCLRLVPDANPEGATDRLAARHGKSHRATAVGRTNRQEPTWQLIDCRGDGQRTSAIWSRQSLPGAASLCPSCCTNIPHTALLSPKSRRLADAQARVLPCSRQKARQCAPCCERWEAETMDHETLLDDTSHLWNPSSDLLRANLRATRQQRML